MGIDHVFVCDNNNVENDENIKEFIDENGYSDFVTAIDNRRHHGDEFSPKRLYVQPVWDGL